MQVGVLAGAAVACAQTRRGPQVEQTRDVTRAVAVYEWTGEMAKPTAARVVPISLYIGKRYEDAGVYLSRPVPLALETGNLYEVEKAGVAVGTVQLETAMHLHVPENAADRYDEGWFAYGVFEAAKSAVSVAKSKTSEDERPHLGKHDSKSDAPSADADRPTLRKAPQAKQKKEVETASVSEAGGLLAEDANRPKLHRGAEGTAHIADLKGVPAEMEQAVMVNDAADAPEHDFEYVFATEGDRDAAVARLRGMAREMVRPAAGAGRYAPILFTGEDFRAFETSYGGAVVWAYAARVGARRVVLLVEPDIYGRLTVLIQQVTDGTTGMRLVDAVDAAGDHRAELLYEVRTGNSRVFKLLRVMAGRVEEVFSTGTMQ